MSTAHYADRDHRLCPPDSCLHKTMERHYSEIHRTIAGVIANIEAMNGIHCIEGFLLEHRRYWPFNLHDVATLRNGSKVAINIRKGERIGFNKESGLLLMRDEDAQSNNSGRIERGITKRQKVTSIVCGRESEKNVQETADAVALPWTGTSCPTIPITQKQFQMLSAQLLPNTAKITIYYKRRSNSLRTQISVIIPVHEHVHMKEFKYRPKPKLPDLTSLY